MKISRLTLPSMTAVLVLGLGACGANEDVPEASGEQMGGDITVFAAASLNEVFPQIAEAFEEEHDGVGVEFNFAGSSDLVAQIAAGAPVDVLATADENTMQDAVDQDLMVGGESVMDQLFATNTLRIVTAPDNPFDIASLEDLADPDLNLVICAPQVPCGNATQSVLGSAGVEASPVSEENSVTDVLGKVTSGQADAGLVYATDAAAAGDAVETITFPEADEMVNSYPIGVVEGSSNDQLAHEFVDFVRSETGLQFLADAGFEAP